MNTPQNPNAPQPVGNIALTTQDVQIITMMIVAAKQGMEAELQGNLPGTPLPAPDRAKMLAEAIGVAQKWISGVGGVTPQIIQGGPKNGG